MSRLAVGLRIIGRRRPMDKLKLMDGSRLAIACAMLACFPLAAHAQTSEGRRVEIGAGIGTVASSWAGPYSGGDLRIGVRASDRGIVETLVGLSPSGAGDEALIGFYGVQFRHDFGG